ncbi:hypothetical protein NMG60_11001412 [Bertholletia excelsa]
MDSPRLRVWTDDSALTDGESTLSRTLSGICWHNSEIALTLDCFNLSTMNLSSLSSFSISEKNFRSKPSRLLVFNSSMHSTRIRRSSSTASFSPLGVFPVAGENCAFSSDNELAMEPAG